MRHLEYDEVFDLAHANVSDEGFDDEQINKLEHLKSCQDCYQSFCLLTMLEDMMGGINNFEECENVYSPVAESVKLVKRKILATVNVIRDNVREIADVVMKQTDKINEPLQFEPVLGMAGRGANGVSQSIIRVEELEDDRTFIAYNPSANKVEIQLNVSKLNFQDVIVVVSFDDQNSINVPLERIGSVLKGVVSDIPNSSFVITIEAELDRL